MQEYLVLVPIASDTEVWRPGSKIKLDDVRAALHLAAGNVRVLENTMPPAPAESIVIVHDAEVIEWQP